MNNEQLVCHLKSRKRLRTPAIISAFEKVDRADFVLQKYREQAHIDYPLPISQGQTISQPTTVALMLEFLQPQKGDKILDIGSGSGWTTALLAKIAGLEGEVWGVERIPELVELGQNNLKEYNFPNAKILQAGEGIGLPEKAPFEKILVSASAKKFPNELIDQLKIGGRIVIPVGISIWGVDKISETEIKKEEHYYKFIFVPLIIGKKIAS